MVGAPNPTAALASSVLRDNLIDISPFDTEAVVATVFEAESCPRR
jgi:hypothetical protein